MSETLDAVTGKVVGSRGAKAFKKWEPKKWLPVYEAIVALSCTGLSNEEVGKRFGYGKQQVSNILNTPQATRMRELINQRLREANLATLAERMDNMNNAAMKHVEFVLNIPSEEFKNPLAIFDRSVMWLKASGKVAGNEPINNSVINNTQNNIVNAAMILTPTAANVLQEGLNKADQVKVIHDGDVGHNKLGPGKSNG